MIKDKYYQDENDLEDFEEFQEFYGIERDDDEEPKELEFNFERQFKKYPSLNEEEIEI